MTKERAREILERMKEFQHVFLNEAETRHLIELSAGTSPMLSLEEVLKLIARGEPQILNSESMFGLMH